MNITNLLKLYEDYKDKKLLVELLEKIGQGVPISTANLLKHSKAKYDHALKQITERETYITQLEVFIAENCEHNLDSEADEFWENLFRKHFPHRVLWKKRESK